MQNLKSVLFSLDIVNTYGSIPIIKAFNLIKNLVYKDNNYNSYSDISKQHFLSILKLILENSYFSFENKYYAQIEGLPMGSASSSIIANIYVTHIESQFYSIQEFRNVNFF